MGGTSMEKKIAELQRLSQEDAVTGLLNRRGGEEKIKELIKKHANKTGAFIMMDGDNFKRINSSYGHQNGEHVTRDCAKQIADWFDDAGVVFRLGADEFIVFYINTDIDLIRLSEKIKSTGKTNFTICSYGAPGTGKSAYAEYLAELLNMSIVKKKTSDLLSMWVGGTERNIANAFREAKDSKAILVFDEADSLLQDRRNAHNSWEVTQVNEMLVQMENHPYPFICTTNLFDKLDQASLRRFTFKIGYKYMTDTQIKLAFKHFFNIDAPVDNFHLSTCTAGDFMNIKKQVEFLGTNSYNDIIEMLRKEQENKNDDKPKTKIGFN